MEIKWVAVIAAWLTVGATVSVCAFAWGAEGRTTVSVMFIAGFLVTALSTGGVAGDAKRKATDVDG